MWDLLPELPINLIMWLNLGAVIITLLVLIQAYRKGDILEERFRILSQNYDSLLAQKILEDMEEVDPEKAEKLRAQLSDKLKMAKGVPRTHISVEKVNPGESSLENLLLLSRLNNTQETGGQE